MSRHSPRVIIGKEKGDKVRCRHPSEMSGYINHTFSSEKEAQKYYDSQSRWATSRAKCFRIRDKKQIKINNKKGKF